MNLNEFLQELLSKMGVTLTDKYGNEYKIDGHETRHEDHDFCLSRQSEILQQPYDSIKNWEVKSVERPYTTKKS